MKRTVTASLLAAALLIPAAAFAQGVPGGIEQGSREGAREAGPIGGIVGGAVGGVVGGINGVLGIDQRPRFHATSSNGIIHPTPTTASCGWAQTCPATA